MITRFKQLHKLKKSKLTDDEYYETDSNNRGIIDVGAENYEDIYSYYDLEGENVLDREFDEFLQAKADAIPIKKELSLHFHVKDANAQKQTDIDRAIKSHYKRELRAKNRELSNNLKFTIYMLVSGFVAFGIYLLLNFYKVHFAVVYIFDLIGYVFLWEVVDNHFLRRRMIQEERLKIYRLIRANIEVFEYVKKAHKNKRNIKK